MRIAIIGSGISGSLVTRLLSTQHEVTLFESNSYVGGHANTVDISVGDQQYAVDTGFMVFNQRTYPNFCRLLQLLECPSQLSEMSFSVRCSKTGLEYQGSSLNGLFAQRANLLRPAFLKMISDIVRFNRLGTDAVTTGRLKDGRTVAEFLDECQLGTQFVQQYLVPMASAIWSSSPQAILEFPADFMIGFFANHGLMQLRYRPQWRTIVGGSRAYLKALLTPDQDQVRLRTPVASVTRRAHDVVLLPVHGLPERFDQVVFASHADQTLGMLADATLVEREVLGAFPYQANNAILHTDTRMLPTRRKAWASWNYHIPETGQQAASVTYDLSRLQNHRSPTPILLTLNPTADIDGSQILRTFVYAHPGFSRASISAQQRFHEISGKNRTHFCGAYWGYGFHEDGVNSALAVARHFEIELDACTAASTKESSRIAVTNR